MGASDTPRDIALNVLGGVLVDHLDKLVDTVDGSGGEVPASPAGAPRPGEAAPPILISLDGPGASDLLERAAPQLRAGGPVTQTPWTVVRFDAWQYQRLQPPWWWLVEALDCQVRAEFRCCPRSARARESLRRTAWGAGRVVTDGLVVLVLTALLVGGVLLFSLSDMLTTPQTTGALAVSLSAVGALMFAVGNAFRRQVLFSHGGQQAVLRASDQMAAFQERYAFLLGARPHPIAFLVENLDRCHATYVVELLEGVQTLLKHRPAARRSAHTEAPLVVFLVAADEAWLCDSFVEVYKSLQHAGSQPGRPFGQAFLDKVFQYSLRVPLLPVMAAGDEAQCSTAERRLTMASQEIEIREIVCAAEAGMSTESSAASVQRLRIAAVKQLGDIEDLLNEKLCSDTTAHLIELTKHIDAAALVSGQLRTAYCSQRTAQFLAGHKIDDHEFAIYRLALWTVLTLRWPLLAKHLIAHPDDIAYLREAGELPERGKSLAAVFADPCARQVACGFPSQAELTPDEVRRFAVPLERQPPRLARQRTLSVV